MKEVKLKYDEFSAEDFALDAGFQKWVLAPDDETRQFWNDLLIRFPQKQNEIDEAKKLVILSGLSTDHEANAAFLATWHKVRENAAASENSPQRRSMPIRYAAIAATLVGILAISYFVFTRERLSELPTFQTQFGETKELSLSDGTHIILNSNSKLGYLTDFKSERKVFLEGEAFFEVTKLDDSRKFTISVEGQLDVEVTGTEFNVNTRRKNIEVYLQSGKVNVTTNSNNVSLQPGEKASFNKESKALAKTVGTPGEIERILGWKSNVFVYNDDLLTTIAEDLHEHYGLEVVIADPTLATRRFTGRIPSQPMDLMLKVLSETLEISIEKKPGKIIIEPLSD